MDPKNLGGIRDQMERALGSANADPIERLDRQIDFARRTGDRTEVLQGLKRFLESGGKGKRRGR
jgi:hypothetical protein